VVPWVIVRRSGAFQIAMILGPLAGGFLYAIDRQLPYVFAVVALLVAAFAIVFATPEAAMTPASDGTARTDAEHLDPAELITSTSAEAAIEAIEGAPAGAAPRPSLHEALEGLRFVRRQPLLLGAISLDLFAVLFGGAIALLPAIAEERLGVGAVGLGWLRASTGIGAGVVTISLAVRPLRRRVGTVLLVSVATFGLGTIVLGLTTSFAIAFVALMVLSGADAISVFIRSTLVPLVTPHGLRGRVLAVETVFIGGSNELGAFESGTTGQLLGPAGAIVLGGVATVAIALTWAVRFPDLRRVDGFPGMEPDPVRTEKPIP
jgi:MFS family permease